jgi:hypothetical protein
LRDNEAVSEELIRAMLGIEEPDPDDPEAVYLDQRQTTAVFILTRWWVPGHAVPLLFALGDRKGPADEPLMPEEARRNLADNIYAKLLTARNDYGWGWKGDEDDPLFMFLVDLAMTFWPHQDCRLDWVTSEALREAEVRQDSIIAKWKQASGG